jgi:hypothetical protein
MTTLVIKPELEMAPAQVVLERIDGLHYEPPGETLRYGENLFRGFPRVADAEMPRLAVFVLMRAGGPPRRMLAPSAALLPVTVGVFIRGLPREFETYEDFARVLWFHLNGTDQRNLPRGYHKFECQESEPEWAGLDGAGHPVWTINVILEREE